MAEVVEPDAERSPIRPVPGTLPTRRLDRWDWIYMAALAAAVCLVYARTIHFEFVNLDDPVQIQENIVVQKGLTMEGLRYAFSATPEGNFMPITWLSHMAVVEIGGHGPAAHHIANFVLHAITSVLVYLFWRLSTGAAGRSAIVAALFALHPLRAESVAWISERKDVLSGVFWMLTLLAYLRYTRVPSVFRYCVMSAFFVVGLLCKSMLVTIPCVMLLLDFWPLGRLQHGHPMKLIAEKIPLFALAAACAAITYFSQETVGAVSSVESLPMMQRLWNAPATYATYLAQTVWPAGLAVMYPYLHSDVLIFRGGLGLALIAVVSAMVFFVRRKRPYLAVGWLWYLGTLVPVIGLVQVGAQAHADRYSYIPHIGLFAGMVWGIASLLENRPQAVRAAAMVSTAGILLLAGVTWRQVGFWRDSEVLFARSLAMTTENGFSEGNYAVALIDKKKYAEAEEHLRKIILMGKAVSRDYHNLGFAILRQNRPAEAQYFFEAAVLGDPKSDKSWQMLGKIRSERLQWPAAIDAYRHVLDLGAGTWDTRLNLAIALGMAKQFDEAAKEFDALLAERPNDSTALFNYGSLLVSQFKFNEAEVFFERQLSNAPDDAEGAYFLAICRAWQGHPEESLTLLTRAVSRDPTLRARAAQDQLFNPLQGSAAFRQLLAGQ